MTVTDASVNRTDDLQDALRAVEDARERLVAAQERVDRIRARESGTCAYEFRPNPNKVPRVPRFGRSRCPGCKEAK